MRTTFDDGTWVVNGDIAPAPNQSVNHGAGCYWARPAGFSYDEYANVIEDFSGVADQVTIDPSDVAFQAYGCRPWTRV